MFRMSMEFRFFLLDAAALRAARFDDDGRRTSALDGARGDVFLRDVVGNEDWDLLDELMEEPEQLGFVSVGDSFRGAWAFFGDVERRMAPVSESDWLKALRDAQSRLPSVAVDDPVLAGLRVPGWVVLDEAEILELVASARDALAADRDWAQGAHGMGPTWQGLVDELERRPARFLLVIPS